MTSNHIVLILAHLMGMYFTSSILLMRMNLPPSYRLNFNLLFKYFLFYLTIDKRELLTEVLGNVQFGFYHRWFDYLFIPSVVISILFLVIKSKIYSRVSQDDDLLTGKFK